MFLPTTTSDLEAVVSCVPNEPVAAVSAARYRSDLAAGRYRPEWSWLYLEDGGPLCRALWWGHENSATPASLDCLWVDASVPDRVGIAAALLDAAHASFRAAGAVSLPEFNLNLSPTWRQDSAAVAAVRWRRDAVARAGLTELLERLSFRWTAGTVLPPRTRRLRFADADDEAFLAVFRDVARGSLDILTRRMVAAVGEQEQARDDLHFYLRLPGRRDWWRLAHDMDGALVGFIIPSRTAYDPSVSYLGVLPAARGRGYVDDLLAEITHMHAEAGAEQITGTTDITNAPMAAAFERAGYEVTSVRLVLSAPPTPHTPAAVADE